MRDFSFKKFILVLGTVFILGSCTTPPANKDGAARVENKARSQLLSTILFYPGYVSGRESHPTGLLMADNEGNWKALAWHELKTFSMHIGRDGKWVYLACGNGVLYSSDGGQTWKLTGSWKMTEVTRVICDPGNPHRAWAASAYGIFYTDDITGGNDCWTLADAGGKFRFASDVLLNSEGNILAGTEEGIFLSVDEGRTFGEKKAGVAVRRLIIDDKNSSRILAATDGSGILESLDGGETWQVLSEKPEIVFCLEQHPGNPEIFYCGSKDGFYVGKDNGKTWERTGSNLPEEYYIYDIAVDPGDSETIVAAGNDGIYLSEDKGQAWKPFGLQEALTCDVEFAVLSREEKSPKSTVKGLSIHGMSKKFEEHRRQTHPDFEENRKKVIDNFTKKAADSKGRGVNFFTGIPEVKEGLADEEFWQRVREKLQKPQHSMFFSMPLTAFYQHCSDNLPEDIEKTIRRYLTENPIYRGDTENHWVMYYTALLLAAQTWPDTEAGDWYNGCSSQENYDEAKGWLEHWAHLNATKGQGEFDSPHYIFMYITPMLLLYDFANEPEVRQLAGMMLDLLLADYLTESLNGAYCGGHSRTSEREVQQGASINVSIFHYLYADGIHLPPSIHSWSIAALYSSYRSPAIFREVANSREEPFVHTEVKRVRNVIRYGKELNPPVYKYDYMTPKYCMGCLQGGILQPIQQHTWDVTWNSKAENPTFFTVHPYCAGYELAMFFPEDIHHLVKAVCSAKSSYSLPDRFVSSSPYEKIFQQENILLAFYNIPPDDRHPHINLYFPDCLEKSEEEGWVFGKDGDFFMAFYSCQDGEWTKEDDYSRFRCSAGIAGFVTLTKPMGNDSADMSYDEFKKMVLASQKPELNKMEENPSVEFQHADGRWFMLEWNDQWGTVNQKDINFPAEKLFNGPFIMSEKESGVIKITDGEVIRGLDFNNLIITEEKKAK